MKYVTRTYFQKIKSDMRRLITSLIALTGVAFWSMNATAQINTFPWVEDLESTSLCASACAQNFCPLTGSDLNNEPSLDDRDWIADNFGTTSFGTGPSVDHTTGTAAGRYIFTETSGCNNFDIWVFTDVVDFTGVSYPVIEWWYHMFGATMGTLDFSYSTNGGTSYTNYAPATVSGNQGDQWLLNSVNCGPTGLNIGGQSNVRFRWEMTTGTSFTSDAALDDFRIYELFQYDAAVDVTVGPPASAPEPGAEYFQVPAGVGPVSTPIVLSNNGWDNITNVFATWDIVGTVDGLVESGVADNGGANYNFSAGQSATEDPMWNPSTDINVTTFNQDFQLTTNIFLDQVDADLTNNADVGLFRRHEDCYRRDTGATINGWVYNPGFNGYWAVAYDFPTAGAFITGGEVVIGADPFNTTNRVGEPVRVDLLDWDAGAGLPGALIMESDEVLVTNPLESAVFCPYPGGFQVTTPGIYVAAYNDVSNLGATGLTANWISTADDIYAPGRFFHGFPITGPAWNQGTPAGEQAMWRIRFKVACGSANAGSDTSFCVGGTAVLGGNPTADGPGAPFTYMWTPAAFLDDPTAANPVATPPLGVTVFYVTATDAAGCIVTDSVRIETFPFDNVAFVGLQTSYCLDDPASDLAGNPPGGYSPGGTSPGTTWSFSEVVQDYSGLPVPIPDAAPGNPGILMHPVSGVFGFSGNADLGVDVWLDSVCVEINHTWIGDVGNFDLENPNGTSVTLMDRPGDPAIFFGCNQGPAQVIFCVEQGTGNDNENDCPPAGTYTAHGGEDLNDLNDGSDANGTWLLSGEDFVGGDAGTIVDLIMYFSPLAGGGTFDPAAAGPGTHDILYCFTNVFGCESCDTQTTTVHPLPDASITAVGPFCLNDANVLLTSATPGGQWTGPGILDMFTGEFAPAVAGIGVHTIYYVVTDVNGCTNNDSTVIEVIDVPSADAGPDLSVCAGDGIQIGGSPTGTAGTSVGGFIVAYNWTPNNGTLSSTSAPNPTATPNTTTTYEVTVTDGNGCSAMDDMLLTVNPTPTVDAGADQTICNGDVVTIGGSPTASGSTAPYTYNWMPATGLSATNVPNPDANPATTTTYTVEVTDANGCVDTDDVTVVVNAAVVADAGVDVTICDGADAVIGGTPTATGGTAPYSYSWTPGGSTLANPTVMPNTTTTYEVTVTDANGCTDMDDMTVFVNPSPTADAGADQVICDNGSVTIGGNPTAVGGTPAYTYVWSPGGSLDDATIANPEASPISSTVYTVWVTDANGCTDMDEVTVTVAPNPVVDAGQDKEVCIGADVQIGGSPTASGGTAPYNYMWAPPNGLSSISVANPTAGPPVTTTYTVEVTDANGCTAQDIVTVEANPGPTADAGVDKDLCIGDSVQIGGAPSATGGTSPYSFYWEPFAGNIDDYSNPNPTVWPTTTTTYTIAVDDNNGCRDVDSVTVTVRPLPTVDLVIDTDYCVDTSSVAMTGTPTGGNFNGPGVQGFTFNPDVAGPGTHMIVYDYTDQYGCTNWDTAFTTVHALPVVYAGDNRTAYKGHPQLLNASVIGDPPFTYVWTGLDGETTSPYALDDPSILQPTASPHITTLYELCVTDVWGCRGYNYVTIEIDPNTPLDPPNAFTPSPLSPGQNDTWELPFVDDFFPDNTVDIYNRWGQLVWNTTNYNNASNVWDGTSNNGGELPGGTYFYVITLSHVDSHHPGGIGVNTLVHRGPVTIIRHD